MGSSLKIVDIYIQKKSSDHYISALHIFEQIIDGQFIDASSKAEAKLLTLVEHCMMKKSLPLPLPIDTLTVTQPKYFSTLFTNFVKKMQKQKILNNLWINLDELDILKNIKLKILLQ